MDKTLILALTDDVPDFQAQFEKALAEMTRLHELMASDQVDIDRLRTRSKENLTEIKVLADRTQAILSTLKAA